MGESDELTRLPPETMTVNATPRRDARPISVATVLAITWATILVNEVRGAALPTFDFTEARQAAEWGDPHHLTECTPTPEGLALRVAGNDPRIIGPPRDFPTDQPLWLHVRLKSEQSGMCQVFYFQADHGPTETNSVRFGVPGAEWFEVKLRVPALGIRHRLRIDPPGDRGATILGRLWFSERVRVPDPAWPKPEPPQLGDRPAVLQSGALKLTHNRKELGGFVVYVDSIPMAAGHNAPMIGYRHHGQPRWIAVNAKGTTVTVNQAGFMQMADATLGGTLTARAALSDPDGGRWVLEQNFKLDTAGALQVEAVARCDQDRDVLYLPLFTLMPGLGSFGTNKTQALLAGVEYLENEPSSSTADLSPPDSYRQVPDTAKLTFPFMAVAARERYLGLGWNPPPAGSIGVVFDTPDRFFGSGSHFMGLLFPGSDGLNREENSLVPYDPRRLVADKPITVAALLLGGRGSTVVPALQEYVRRFGLPSRPEIPGGPEAYFALASRGWLESQIREGDRYRHATPGFPSMPASDAAFYQEWLSHRVSDSELASRLITSAQAALRQVAPPQFNQAQVGHVRYPLPALVFGAVTPNLEQAEQAARSQLARFEEDGLIHYRPRPNGLDFGRTHWASHANGLTAAALATLLEDAAFVGRQDLIEAGLHHLRALTRRYQETVPRGAQTWEIALHTPDILAAAHLVRAYVLGHELSGDADFLEQAQYWAWTGVPFVYLVSPTDKLVGAYATIAVLGSTHWVAPNWIGLPVQWCGLVYAEAIQRLARLDPSGPWRELATGIVRSAVLQTYPASDTQYLGLLPDSYHLRTQTRNPANINAATVLAPAIRAFQQPPIYDFRALHRIGIRLHAPGELSKVEEREKEFSFRIEPWSRRPCFVLINGLKERPKVTLNGQTVTLADRHDYQSDAGRLVLAIEGPCDITVLASPAPP